MNKAKCSSCKEEKVKIFSKYRMRENRWQVAVYADETGRQWNWSQCPDCRNHSRKPKKAPQDAQKASHKRKCRHCGYDLTVNYFYHSECLDQLEFSNDEHTYYE